MTSRTVTTDATGQCDSMPSSATVEALAVGEGESPTDARAIAKDKAATIRRSIGDVSPEQVRTVDLQVKDSEDMFGPDTDAAFLAKERIHIDCPPEDTESVVVDVTLAGGQIQTIHFNLQESERQQLQDEALRLATERAHEKAEKIATTEGFAGVEVLELSSKEVNTGMKSIVDEALASSSEKDMHPSPITVSAGVEGVYELIEE